MAIMNAAARAVAEAAKKATNKTAQNSPSSKTGPDTSKFQGIPAGAKEKIAAAKSLPPNMPMPSRTVRDPRVVASGGSAGTGPKTLGPGRTMPNLGDDARVSGGTGPKTLGPGRTMPNLGNDVRTNGFQVMPEGAVPGRPLPKPVSPSSISAATGPMTPVRGGGMAPASVATMMKKGGRVKAKAKSSYSSGGNVGSASKRADGCAQRGKTKGKVI